MIPFTHLTMLIAAFLGANLSGAELNLRSDYLESKYRDPDVVTDYCWGHDDETDDYHNNYADSWYSWERCLLRDAQGTQIKYDNTHRLSKDEAEELVEEVWQKYTPWMREKLSQNLFFPDNKNDPEADHFQLVISEDWTPRFPLINKGEKKVHEHCSEGAYGCAVPPGLNIRWTRSNHNKTGESVWWWSDNTYERYGVWPGTLTYRSSGRIVTPKQNRFVVLHELAHSINGYQYRWLNDDHTSDLEHRENERTEGHGYEFRCLALDLYNDYGGDIAKIIPWWEESYAHLNRLCQIIAPGYAQPITDDESNETEDN